jgi:hypothetical protein
MSGSEIVMVSGGRRFLGKTQGLSSYQANQSEAKSGLTTIRVGNVFSDFAGFFFHTLQTVPGKRHRDPTGSGYFFGCDSLDAKTDCHLRSFRKQATNRLAKLRLQKGKLLSVEGAVHGNDQDVPAIGPGSGVGRNRTRKTSLPVFSQGGKEEIVIGRPLKRQCSGHGAQIGKSQGDSGRDMRDWFEFLSDDMA